MPARAARRLAPACLLAGCLLLCGLPPRPAAAADNAAQNILDALTKSPAARQQGAAAPGKSTAGPVAPTQPTAPVVPGAPPADASGQPGQSGQSLREQLSPHGAAPRQDAPAVTGGVLTLEFDGLRRQALVRLPRLAPARKGQPAAKPPALIFLHGAAGSAAQAMRQTGLGVRAPAAGYVAVFPEGLGDNNGNGGGQTWNAWNCCGYARDQKIDDVGYLAALMARLKADFGVDPRRIYLAGFSNGAMLASRFALERPGVVAAIAVVAGTLPCDAQAPAEPLPVLLIHGNRDRMARFAPTEAHPRTGRACEDFPAKAQADFWVRHMGLGRPQVQDGKKSRARVEDYGGRTGRASLRYVIVKGGGHAWPGGPNERYRYCDAPTADPDATGLVLEFFRAHSGVSGGEAAKTGKPASPKAVMPPAKKARR